MTWQPIQELKVSLCFSEESIPVGRLAERDGIVYFEYEREWIDRGIEISPIRMPLAVGIKTFDRKLFDGLPGVFYDSLPDGWGRLLLERAMRAKGILPESLTPLDRLAHVGRHGMGALVYEPEHTHGDTATALDLDTLAQQTAEVLSGGASDVLQALLSLNGSSAGARPKAMIAISQERKQIVHGAQTMAADFSPWIVKFPNLEDGPDAGAIEYTYSIMARDAGIMIPETHLFSAQRGGGYFATKRFDRAPHGRLHMHTAGGLLHSDFRLPSLDYEDLITLTMHLTRDVREVEKMMRLAAFNVLAHNRDDHAKNFSFLMDERGEWKLAPAYDLTFSNGPRGEHSTTVMGEGKTPTLDHLYHLGAAASLNEKSVRGIIAQTQEALSNWPELAKTHGVSNDIVQAIAQALGCWKVPG